MYDKDLQNLKRSAVQFVFLSVSTIKPCTGK